jgi:hypothetical protein
LNISAPVSVCILFILAGEIIGFALAQDDADQEMVDNETLDIMTITQNYMYSDDQAVFGTGFANINSNFATPDPDDPTPILDLKVRRSGSGTYSHNSSIALENDSFWSYSGDFSYNYQNITDQDETNAVYSEVNFQFPGSFKVKSIRSLWKDQTSSKNYAGLISMNSRFDQAKRLKKESTTTLSADVYSSEEFIETTNSTIGSSMNINSSFDGTAHLGAAIDDMRGYDDVIAKPKPNRTLLVDEDYRGTFNLSRRMAVNITKTTDYADNDANYESSYYEDYPWLPCACMAGWADMTVHDTRYHSAKDFFSCATCGQKALCKN